MKKLLFTTLFIFGVTMVMAQDAACSVGLQLGFNQQIIRTNTPISVEGQTPVWDNRHLNGVKIGFVFEGNIIRGFGALISLNYSYGGGSTSWKKIGIELPYPRERYRYNLHTLDLACDWQYKFKLAQRTFLILYTGPAIQCNLSFHEQYFKQEDISGDITCDTKDQLIRGYQNADDYKAYRRFNVTWGVGIGFQYDRYFIRGGYDFGLINPLGYDNFDQIVNQQTQKPLYISQHTSGRQDQWFIKLGIFLWQSDK